MVSSGIIIASAVAVGSNHGGLYASAADVVISVDEDWSGRGNSFIDSILSRIRTRHYTVKSEGSNCKFIKLISENTCENLFYTDSVVKQANKESNSRKKIK
eukprot:14153171-Ditylum_brightwellii.AAC.1